MTVLSVFVTAVTILVVFFFLRTIATERKLRQTARRLFLKAQGFQATNQYEKACKVLHFIRWGLVGKPWFENFIRTDKVVTHEAFVELNKFVLEKSGDKRLFGEITGQERLLSGEELAQHIERIQEMATPPERHRQAVLEAIEKYWGEAVKK